MFDFVGIDATMKLAASTVRQRGKVTMVGLGGGTLSFSYGVMPHATTIGYTFGGSLSDLAKVVTLAESGRVKPEVQKFPFDQIDRAYHELHDGKIQGRGIIIPD